jgi:GntR family transcriptional regulator
MSPGRRLYDEFMYRDAAPHLREDPANAARRRLGLMLRSAIVRGDYADGRLPSERELMQEYDASRAVVRDTLNLLRDTGVVTREHGVGTVAGDMGSIFGLLDLHGVLDEELPEHNVYARVIDRSIIKTPAVVLARIPNAGPQVLRIEFLAVPHKYPGAVSTNYFVLPQGERLGDLEFGRNIYEFVHRGGIALDSTEFLIGAAMADESIASRLHTHVGAPILTLEQIMYDETGAGVCFSTVAMRGDRVAIHSRIDRAGVTE